ncbi:MAG: hypothetical protein HY237_13620 [Acidobacteria bacterium]|nr:hypothetical protein [Acidobacteriota bacterium]
MTKLAHFSVEHPRLVVAVTLALTLLFAAQLPKIKTDTDPKNMLPVTSPVRQYNKAFQMEGKDEFVRYMLQNIPTPQSNAAIIRAVNLGLQRERWLTVLPRFGPLGQSRAS